ncbi:MAG: hypothetical protein RL521_278 [Bacteroidota bacterium]
MHRATYSMRNGLWNGMRWLLLIISFFASPLMWSQLQFIPNQGQWEEEVKFMTPVAGGRVWSNAQGLRFELFNAAFFQSLHPGTTASNAPQGHVFDCVWKDALPHSEWRGEKHFPFYHQYFLGNRKGKTLVYESGSLLEVYPGIDVHWGSVTQNLKYDWRVQPGADPSQIKMEWDPKVDINLQDGDLIVQSKTGTIIEKKPYAFQWIRNKIVPVDCKYVLHQNTVTFEIGAYDAQYELIIDPEIIFSTYIGSTSSTFGFTASNDAAGNLISGATVFGQNYPTTPGAFSVNFNTTAGNIYDLAITKFSADGTALLYSTFIGGEAQETPHSIVVDNNDNIYIMGVTGSANFPAQPGAFDITFSPGSALNMNTFFYGNHPQGADLFVAKLDNTGALSNCSFIGNNDHDGLNFASGLFYNYGDAFRGEINIHPNGNIFIATTVRGSFPVTGNALQPTFGGGASDGALIVMSPNLDNLLYASYIGGSGDDACYAVQFDNAGQVLLCGGTKSVNFPIPNSGFDSNFNGNVDGFILKINPTNYAITGGTYIGTSDFDQAFFVQCDNNNNVYVLGQTNGNMPITAGCYGQSNSGLFVQKYNNSISTLTWNTVVGTGSGEVDLSPTAFLVSDCEQIFFSGWGGGVNSNCGGAPYTCMATSSTTLGLPITANAQQTTTDGDDFYLCVLSPNAANIVYGSFYGGAVSSEHVDGGTSRFSKNGFVYQAVCAGCQGNDDFPTSPSAYSASNPSTGCNIAVFKLSLSPIYADANLDAPGDICPNQTIAFENLSTGATLFEWDFGDGQTSTDFAPQHAYVNPGNYTVQLVASDAVLCLLGDTISIPITVSPLPSIDITATIPFCEGNSTPITAVANGPIQWTPNEYFNDPLTPTPTANPDSSVWLYAETYNSCGSAMDSIWQEVWPINVQVMDDPSICLGESVVLEVNGGNDYQWQSHPTLSNLNIAQPTATPLSTTTYYVDVTTADGCPYADSIVVAVFDQLPGLTAYPDVHVCWGVPTTLTAEVANTYQWLPANVFDDPNIAQPSMTLTQDTYISVNMTNGCGAGSAAFWALVENPNVTLACPAEVCTGDTLLAQCAGAVSYEWLPASWLVDTLSNSAWVTPSSSGDLMVIGTDAYGCRDTAFQSINLLPLPFIELPDSVYFEYPNPVQVVPETNIFNGQWWPTEFVLCDTCASTSFFPVFPTEYHFTIADDAGCGASDSVKVIPLYPFWVPNTFTPNQDAINDGFRVISFFPMPYFHFQIFDRWGVPIFETTDPDRGWDGSFNGYYVPQDVYTWQLKFVLPSGEQKHRGHVTILR